MLIAMAAALAVPSVEEAVFRRMVKDAVMNRGGSAWVQVMASAMIFGGAHAIFGLIKLNLVTAWRAARITGILGGLSAVVYLAGGRSLAPCAIAQSLITIALEPGLMIAAVTDDWRNAAAPPVPRSRWPDSRPSDLRDG